MPGVVFDSNSFQTDTKIAQRVAPILILTKKIYRTASYGQKYEYYLIANFYLKIKKSMVVKNILVV